MKGKNNMAHDLVTTFICLVLAIVFLIQYLIKDTRGFLGFLWFAIYAIVLILGIRSITNFGNKLEAEFTALKQNNAISGPVEAGEQDTQTEISN